MLPEAQDPVAVPTLAQKRADLEGQLADIAKQEAAADSDAITAISVAFSDPAIDKLIGLSRGAAIVNPGRAANVQNILVGLGAMRDAVAHMVTEITGLTTTS